MCQAFFVVVVNKIEVCLRKDFGINIQKMFGDEGKVMAYRQENSIALFWALVDLRCQLDIQMVRSRRWREKSGVQRGLG